MKIRVLLFIVTLAIAISACRTPQPSYYVCGLARSIVVDPEFDLYRFQGFIDTEQHKPLSVIHLDTQRVYSPDYQFYFEYQTVSPEKAILYHADRRPITTVEHLPEGERLIWLDNCVILEGSSSGVKTVIHLTTGKAKTYQTKGWFMFLGQTNQKAFFASHSENRYLLGKKIKSRHSIVSLHEKGLRLVVSNRSISNSYRDSVYFYPFYNSTLAIRCLKHEGTPDLGDLLKAEFISGKKVVLRPDSTSYFDAEEDSYFANGATYVQLNGKEIYKVTQHSFEKIFDFREAGIPGWIREFKIEGEYLIFKAQNSGFVLSYMNPSDKDSVMTVNGLMAKRHVYGYHTIGIVNLKTKECTYPAIQ